MGQAELSRMETKTWRLKASQSEQGNNIDQASQTLIGNSASEASQYARGDRS